jgi:mono/diheme cytochrome c family protein
LWKEFAFTENGHRKKIETRLMERLNDGKWNMQSFLWNEAQTDAVLAPGEGVKNYYKLANGEYYDIPSQQDCLFCHSKGGADVGPQKTPVLGFSALQLSDDRDINAIHGETLYPRMLTLSILQNMKRVTMPMASMPVIPESEKHPLQRRVFGYLYGNCAHCHNQAGMAELSTTLSFYHDANATHIQQNDTYRTALDKSIANYLQPANSPSKIIEPGNAALSAIIYRMTNEYDQYSFVIPPWHHSGGFAATFGVKMPFVGTNVIDEEAVSVISSYIDALQTR